MINFHDFLLEKIDYVVCNRSKSIEPLHILLCFDDNYALAAGINILSVLENNKKNCLHFHLFMLNVSEHNRSNLRAIRYQNASVSEYIINNQFTINSNNTRVFPLSACLRLIAPELLNQVATRLLYLDADTLCLGDLSSLQKLNMDKYVVAAIPDIDEMQIKQSAKYGLTQGQYFNSGVILFDVHKWCQYDLTSKTLELLNSGNTYDYPDQDVLNILIGKECHLLSKKFNQFVALSPNGNEDIKVPEDTILIHYVTKNKPWHQPYRTKLFDSYLSKSPWCHAQLPRYGGKKISSVRQYSRLMYRQGHYFTALKYYFIYIRKKLFK